MSITNLYFALLGTILSGCVVSLVPEAQQANKGDIVTWPRMRADTFGCYLEEKFGIRDDKFNCALKDYTPSGSSCDENAAAYYEGPRIPDSVAPTIHPLLDSIELNWEHGELQSLTLRCKKRLSQASLREMFSLPSSLSYPKEHPNIVSIAFEECRKNASCLTLVGFEHQGAADVECRQR